MRDGIYREIEAELESLRAQNHAEETRRLAEAAQADPEIGALYAKRLTLFRAQAEAAFASPENALSIAGALKAQVDALQRALRGRLLSAGFPEDYLQPVYRCAACRDTGYVGEPIRERCACFSERLRSRAASVGGHGLDPAQTFESYDASVYDDAPVPALKGDSQRAYMARLAERCASYAALYPNNPKRNLLFLGKTGLGKTYLLNCIGNRLRSRGVEVLKVTAYQMSQRMRAAIFDREPEAFGDLLDVPVLLLDDLGVEPMINNITLEQLFTLLNERELGGLNTLVSTNLAMQDLEAKYTDRICSRLFDKRNTLIIPFHGKDVRMRTL